MINGDEVTDTTFIRSDYIIVYTIVVVVWLIFLISYIPGVYSDFYNDLILPGPNAWYARIGWVIATILSYISLYLLVNKISAEEYLSINILFVVITFLMIAWSVALFYFRDIGLSTWITLILLFYQFWLAIYIFNINHTAGIFLIPLVLMYLYLFYFMIHLSYLNDIPL